MTYDRELLPRDDLMGPMIDEIIGHLRDSQEPVPPSLLTLRRRYQRRWGSGS